MRRIKAFINPLSFLEVDLPSQQNEPTLENIVTYICPPKIPCDVESLIKRYKEISTEPVKLSVAPAEQRILDKLVWPLRHAKAAFMVGNYISVVALCGMVSEMVAILLWETTEAQLNGRSMTKEDEKSIFGSSFEKLGQEKRIRILLAYNVINSESIKKFEVIKDIRRKYLHLWSQDHDSIPNDAIKAYHAAVSLVTETIGQDFIDGKVVLNKQLVKYLERHGVYEPSNDQEG